MAELRARQLTKRFSGIAVVKDVDFTIRPGEIVGYLGPNGSGKTTTAKMLAGLLVPSSGRVEYDGRDIHLDPIAYRHELGFIQEEAFLYPFLSGREYLELIGRLREMPESLLTTKIDRFLDESVTLSRDIVFIVHGHGTGALRSAIRAHVQRHPALAKSRAGEPNEGGDGVTVLFLRD